MIKQKFYFSIHKEEKLYKVVCAQGQQNLIKSQDGS